jgi:DNA polymerase III epsilon subunit-like protein
MSNPAPLDFANATPLIALDAVVLDTETTGLDRPGKAWLVEIAALRLQGGGGAGRRAAAADRCRLRPGEPIPAEATASTASTTRPWPPRPRLPPSPEIAAALDGKV